MSRAAYRVSPDPCGSESEAAYATAKAGLVRLTTSLRGFDERIRVNSLVRDWIATERLTDTERKSDPPPISPSKSGGWSLMTPCQAGDCP